jgi:hypothetical protein
MEGAGTVPFLHQWIHNKGSHHNTYNTYLDGSAVKEAFTGPTTHIYDEGCCHHLMEVQKGRHKHLPMLFMINIDGCYCIEADTSTFSRNYFCPSLKNVSYSSGILFE